MDLLNSWFVSEVQSSRGAWNGDVVQHHKEGCEALSEVGSFREKCGSTKIRSPGECHCDVWQERKEDNHWN